MWTEAHTALPSTELTLPTSVVSQVSLSIECLFLPPRSLFILLHGSCLTALKHQIQWSKDTPAGIWPRHLPTLHCFPASEPDTVTKHSAYVGYPGARCTQGSGHSGSVTNLFTAIFECLRRTCFEKSANGRWWDAQGCSDPTALTGAGGLWSTGSSGSLQPAQ